MGKQHDALFAAKLAGSSGGGSGTRDYSDLSNKPQINGVTLSGDKSSAALGIVEPWTGTSAQYAQQAASISIGTPVIITDDEDPDYITYGNGKRLYLTDTEPTGSDIPSGSVWLGGGGS